MRWHVWHAASSHTLQHRRAASSSRVPLWRCTWLVACYTAMFTFHQFIFAWSLLKYAGCVWLVHFAVVFLDLLCHVDNVMHLRHSKGMLNLTQSISLHCKAVENSRWFIFTAGPHCLQCWNRCITYGLVCHLSVFPSHSGVLSIRMKLRSCGFHCQVAQSF